MSHLASLRAKEAYIETANSIESKLPTAPIFTSEGGGRGTWTSIVNFEAKVETEYKDGLTELIKDKSFSYQKVNDKIKLSYQYNTILEDYQYLNAFLDHYWREKISAMFTTTLPITYAIFALILLGFHIYGILHCV